MTTTWAFARPVPALLTAVHSYEPSSTLEARGISQLLFPDALQRTPRSGHTDPRKGAQPQPAPGSLQVLLRDHLSSLRQTTTCGEPEKAPGPL